jgi:hypothetical protein
MRRWSTLTRALVEILTRRADGRFVRAGYGQLEIHDRSIADSSRVDRGERPGLGAPLGPLPVHLLNLALSFQAAYAAPIIMMSQNRQAAKDRLMAEQDYLVNTMAEEEVKAIMHHLEQQDEAMIDILQRMEQQYRAIISGFAAMGFNGSGTPAPA